MNPVEYWYDTNERLKNTMDSYFNQYVELIEDQTLRHDAEHLYQHGSVMEKSVCLSLVGTLKIMNEGKSKGVIRRNNNDL